MKPKSFMVIAGEPSGDLLAAELVRALRQELNDGPAIPTWDYQPLRTGLAPRFFGAGGPHMAEAGVELAFDLTLHSVTGLSEVLKEFFKFRRLFRQLLDVAIEREPDVIICVDFAGFNRRFAHAIKQHVRSRADWFHDWKPRIVQYNSPQVWASREGRAFQMARDFDLLLSLFPFEKAWYARKVPRFHVEFVGHPILDRYPGQGLPAGNGEANVPRQSGSPPRVLLLPGSRSGELARHLPPLLGALTILRKEIPELRARMVLPNERLAQQVSTTDLPTQIEIQIGNLPEALQQTDLAIASTGTVTLECAYFGVPTVALYKTSWATFQIAKRIATVTYLAMPNLLAGEQIVPEFIQDAATPENLARASLDLLRDEARRRKVKQKFAEIIASLGGHGAVARAAREILKLLDSAHSPNQT